MNQQWLDKNGDRLWGYFLNVLTIAVIVAILFPMYWMVNSALLPVEKVYNVPTAWFPIEPTLEHFEVLFNDTNFLTYYVNSIILTVGVVTIQTVASTLGGYGLTRIKFPYKRLFARTLLFGYMFPPILLSIPMYIIWREVGLINSYVGTILALAGASIPVTLWIMWQFFQTVPYSLEESAQMAGASRFRAFYEIALPQAKPGVVAIATLSYATIWSSYTIPKVLLPDSDLWPLTLGLDAFVQQAEILWPQIMASAAMALIPSFIFLYVLQSHWKIISM